MDIDRENRGYSSCRCCGMTWNRVKAHTTHIDDRSGLFALCKECWQDLKTPEARLPYYRELWRSWARHRADRAEHMAEWELIKNAVMAGR